MLCIAASARAAIFVEAEPNGTFATAQLLVHDGSIKLNGSGSDFLADIDYFRFDATAADVITVKAYGVDGIANLDSSIFTIVTLFDASTNQLVQGNYGSGIGGSAAIVNFTILQSGSYFAEVGVHEVNPHNYAFEVTGLTQSLVNGVPEPASGALVIAGLGLVGVVTRRRQRQRASAS